MNFRTSELCLFYVLLSFLCIRTQASCRKGCGRAIASYYVWEGSNLSYISTIFSKSIEEIIRYNPDIRNPDSIQSNTRVNVPFSCDCMNGDFLGHTFNYTTQYGDTYNKIATTVFANLTSAEWVETVNRYPSTQMPDYVPINVTVNCSCGDRRVSKAYGLFSTYPLRSGENLSSIAGGSGLPSELLQNYNPGSNFSSGSGPVFLKSSRCSG